MNEDTTSAAVVGIPGGFKKKRPRKMENTMSIKAVIQEAMGEDSRKAFFAKLGRSGGGSLMKGKGAQLQKKLTGLKLKFAKKPLQNKASQLGVKKAASGGATKIAPKVTHSFGANGKTLPWGVPNVHSTAKQGVKVKGVLAKATGSARAEVPVPGGKKVDSAVKRVFGIRNRLGAAVAAGSTGREKTTGGGSRMRDASNKLKFLGVSARARQRVKAKNKHEATILRIASLVEMTNQTAETQTQENRIQSVCSRFASVARKSRPIPLEADEK